MQRNSTDENRGTRVGRRRASTAVRTLIVLASVVLASACASEQPSLYQPSPPTDGAAVTAADEAAAQADQALSAGPPKSMIVGPTDQWLAKRGFSAGPPNDVDQIYRELTGQDFTSPVDPSARPPARNLP